MEAEFSQTFPFRVPIMPLSVLILEDDHVLRERLCDILNLEGIAAAGVGTLHSFRAWRKSHECDVLVVDRDLPDGDGLEAVRLYKETHNGRTVVVSGHASLEHRIQGIHADTDYYISKPVDPTELIELLRQYETRNAHGGESGWIYDTRRWKLHAPGGQIIPLTQSETKVISCFVETAGLTIPRADVIKFLGKSVDSYDPRRLEIMIRRLRKKVKDHGAELPLNTVYGGGYSFVENLRKSE